MYSSFTHHSFTATSKCLFALLLTILWGSSINEVKAQVKVSPLEKLYTISADKAVGGPNAGFTSLQDVVIEEQFAGDFKSSGVLNIDAPAGWFFRQTGITVNITSSTADIQFNNSSITVINGKLIKIPYTTTGSDIKTSFVITGLAIQTAETGVSNGGRGMTINSVPSVDGLGVTIAKLNQVAGAPAKLSFAVQPRDTLVNAILAKPPRVEVTDVAGNKVPNSYTGSTVSLEITSSTNPYGALLKNGTATYQANGATFSNVSIDEGGKYTLTAKMGNLQGISNTVIIANKTPSISQVQGCVVAGATEGEITITGQDFVRASVVNINGNARTTTYVNGQQLTATLTSADLISAQALPVTVTSPVTTNGVLTSSVVSFTPASINAGLDQESSCSGAAAGTSFTLAATASAGTYAWAFESGMGTISNASTLNPTIEVKSASARVRLTITTASGCTFSDDVVLTVTPTGELQQEPLLVSRQTDNANNIWEISIDLTGMSSINLGANPVYAWYTKAPDGEWSEPVETTTTNRFILDNPPVDLQVQARVLNRDNCQMYAFGFGQAAPLPVELMNLKAVKHGNDALITWSTAMEKNNKGFEVEVSEDGFKYRSLGFVPTKNGNSATKQDYTYRDIENGKSGLRYYRIKQVDEDGTTALYGPKQVYFEELRSQVKVYPNPFAAELHLEIAAERAQPAYVTIQDMLGKLISARRVQLEKGVTSEVFMLPENLPRGMYVLKVQQGKATETIKLIKD